MISTLNAYKEKIILFVGRFIKPELIKHFFIYSFGILIYGLAQFLLIPIFTRKFTPADYGELELVNVAITILLYITIFGLHQLIQVEYYKLNKEEKKIFFKDIGLILILITTPVYILIFAGYFALKAAKIIEDSSHLFLFGIAGTYLNIIIYLYLYYLQISKQSKKYTIIRSINGVALIGFNILLIFYFNLGIISYIISNFVFNLLLLIYALYEYKIQFGFKFKFNNLNRLKKYFYQGLPFLFTTLIYFITMNFDKYLIGFFLTKYEVGIYSVAYRFGQCYEAFFIVPVSLAYSAHLFDKFSKGDFYQDYRIITIYSLALFGCFALITPFIARFIIGVDYRAALVYMPFLVLGFGIVFINSFYIFVVNYFKKSKILIRNSLITLLVYLAGNIILINTLGLWGAVIAFILSNLVFLALTYFSVKNILIAESKLQNNYLTITK